MAIMFLTLPAVVRRPRDGISGPSGKGALHGTTAVAGAPDTLVSREVLLFLERSARPFSIAFGILELVDHKVSAADGSWSFSNLNTAMRFTVIAIDSSGVYDPVVKSGLVPTAED
jgi:hypothetical protein